MTKIYRSHLTEVILTGRETHTDDLPLEQARIKQKKLAVMEAVETISVALDARQKIQRAKGSNGSDFDGAKVIAFRYRQRREERPIGSPDVVLTPAERRGEAIVAGINLGTRSRGLIQHFVVR